MESLHWQETNRNNKDGIQLMFMGGGTQKLMKDLG